VTITCLRGPFREMRENGELLESARVYGHWYGVPRSTVREALGRGQDAIVKVDVQGAATIRGLVSQAILIFIARRASRSCGSGWR